MASEDVSSVTVEPPSDPSLDQQDVESGRVTSNEPLIASKHQTLPEIRMEQLEDTIKDVLKTRPSVRMASRHRVLLSPIHSPLHDSFNRTDTKRHTLPHSPMHSAKSDSQDQSALTVRRRQLRKASFLSSYNLGNGFPLQRRNSPNLNVEDGSLNIGTALRDNPLVTSSNTTGGLSIVVQDVERDETTQSIGEEEINVHGGTLERSNELRKSTLHLKHRMLKQ